MIVCGKIQDMGQAHFKVKNKIIHLKIYHSTKDIEITVKKFQFNCVFEIYI